MQNKYTRAFGVVLGPGTTLVVEERNKSVQVIITSGADKGITRNWYEANAEIVHGVYTISSREGF